MLLEEDPESLVEKNEKTVVALVLLWPFVVLTIGIWLARQIDKRLRDR